MQYNQVFISEAVVALTFVPKPQIPTRTKSSNGPSAAAADPQARKGE